jgi:hypothetical protein
MLGLLTILQLSSAMASLPAPDVRFSDFSRFASANDRCYSFFIEGTAAVDLAVEAAMASKAVTEEKARALVKAEIARNDRARTKDPSRWCQDTRELFEAYDPVYLRETGVSLPE